MSLPFLRRLLPLLALLCATRAAAAPLPADLAPFFDPPPVAPEALAAFRSPLFFADGSPVRTPADWARRRAEVVEKWHALMGPWPPLLVEPRFVIHETIDREGIAQHRIEVEIAAGMMAAGYLLVPPGAGKRPAVFVPFYEPETSIGWGKEQRDLAWQLARRGFVTLAIGSPGGDARRPELGGARCQPLSFLAYIAANAAQALAGRPEVDAARVGIAGHSYGGKWAMFGACLSERFACGAWSDPGVVFDEKRPGVNYWDPWYLGAQSGPPRPLGLPDAAHPRTGAYRALVEQRMDLHELQALMAPRPFLVSGGAEDTPARWPALVHVVAVNRLLGHAQRVGLTHRPAHNPTPQSNEQIVRFFAHFLAPDPAPRPASQ